MEELDLQPHRVADSIVDMTELVFPNDANLLGNMMGGRVMHLIDVAAGIAAMRHAGNVTSTASMDSLDFLNPIKVGQVVILRARINWAGRTSMEIGVEVYAEDLRTGHRVHTCTALLTFVALDGQGRPTPVPPLLLENDAERERFQAAAQRRAERLSRKQRPS